MHIIWNGIIFSFYCNSENIQSVQNMDVWKEIGELLHKTYQLEIVYHKVYHFAPYNSSILNDRYYIASFAVLDFNIESKNDQEIYHIWLAYVKNGHI